MKKLTGILLMLVLLMGALSGFAIGSASQAQSAVFLDSATGLETAYLPEDGSVKVKLDFIAPFDGTATVIAAQHDTLSALSKAEILTTLTTTEGAPVSYTSDDISVSDAKTLKIYVWGGSSMVKPVLNVPAVIQKQGESSAVSKFEKAHNAPEAYVTGTVVKLGDIFAACENAEALIKSGNVQVFGNADFSYISDTSDWANGTLVFNDIGPVSLTITDYSFCVPFATDVTVKEPDPVAKFEAKAGAETTFTDGDAVKLGDIFSAIDGAEISDAGVFVTSESENVTITYVSDSADWTNGTVKFSGVGDISLTVTDNNYCVPTTVSLNVEYKTVEKFAKSATASEEYTMGDVVELGTLFAAVADAVPAIDSAKVNVTVASAEGSTAAASLTANAEDWTKGTVAFDGTGALTLTITDGYYCIPTSLTLTVKEPEPVDKFVSKFTNTNYLYRVGNKNDVALGSIFGAIDGVEIGNVTATVTPVDSSSDASGTFTANADWTKATIDFNGAGPVEITIDDDNYANALSIRVEVIDATNATKAVSATSGDVVLLNDVNGTFSVSGGNTFFGNGFTVNIGTDYRAAGLGTGFIGKINLNSGNLDNVKIVGPVYPVANIYQDQAADETNLVTDYFYNTVIVNGGNCKITNSYISGSRAALCIKSGAGDVLIENTTLSGGSYANLEIKSSSTITLKDVTTVQEEVPNSYDVTDSSGNVKNMMGMGIIIDNAGAKLYVEGTFNQYNWVNQTQWSSMVPTSYQSVFPKLFTDSKFEANRHYRDGDTTPYVNTGIISLVTWNNGANIIDNRTDKTLTYTKTNVTLGGVAGGVCAITNAGTLTDALYYAPDYTSDFNAAATPKAVFDYTTLNNEPSDGTSNVYCYYDATSGKYLISFDEGDLRVWDGKILTVTKGTKTLGYTMSVSGGLSVGADNTVTFEDAGEYTVTYTYTDENNYRLVDGQVEKYPVTYTKTVDITVFEIEAAAVPADFNFLTYGHRSETINDTVYVMPDVTATVSSNTAGIKKTTVGGVDVYYPVVSMHKSGLSSWYNYFSVFEGVTITDSDQTTVYNTSTTSLPSTLEVIGGFILDANGAVSTAESANGTGIFNYDTGKEIKTMTYSTYGVGYYPDSKFDMTTKSRDEQTIVAKYRYTDSNGKQYYYYIGYWCEKHTKTSICVAPDTLVTMGDGSKRKIKDVSVGEEVLAWNFTTGAYEVVPASLAQVDGNGKMNVLNLIFEDGTKLRVLGEHGIFDADLNTFIFIDEGDVEDYLGHKFVKKDGDSYKTVALADYFITKEDTAAYTILSTEHYNVILEDMFTVTPAHVGDNFFNPFEIGEGMKYDAQSVQEDIEKYGLYTYEDFAHVLTYEQFVALNMAQLKVSVGKGYVTYDGLIYLIENFINR